MVFREFTEWAVGTVGRSRRTCGFVLGLALSLVLVASASTVVLADTDHVPSIALDSQGNPHVCYTEAGSLWYAANVGGTWVKRNVDDSGNFTAPRIAVDSNNGVHISYADWNTMKLKYAHRSGTAWTIVTVDPSRLQERFSAMAVSSTGVAHLFYEDFNGGNGKLKYARRALNGSWSSPIRG